MLKCNLAKLSFLMMLAMLLGGCGLKYTVREPTPSDMRYTSRETASTTLTIVDRRTGEDAHFLVGKLGFGATMSDISKIVKLENIQEPIGYLAIHLERELARRGIPVKCVVAQSDGSGPALEVNRYQIANYRASGFSPWEACHIFAGTLIVNGQRKTIKAYFYNGKTPVWSMDEISDPCFNIPTSILIKDIASKINRIVFHCRASDAAVDELTAEIDSGLLKNEPGGPFWKVLELGYTNNPKAMEPLKKYATESDEFFKSCALSAIGILGPEEQFEFLKQRYGAGGFNDRYMAVKAIGDIGTAQAVQFVRSIRQDKGYGNEGGLISCVDLYAP